MSARLQELLDEKGVLLADGAMGTNLMAQGLKRGEVSEVWNVDHPDRVTAVHAAFIEVGADIVLTNSFGGNRLALEKAGLGDRVVELNHAAAQNARRAADAAGRPVVVGGSIGPTGQLLKPYGKLAPDQALAVFTEQAMALAEGGVDVIWVETMSSPAEMQAAMTAAAATGLPFTATMSFDTKGRTMMGTKPAAARESALAADPAPLAFGANCGSGPRQMIETVLAFAEVSAPGEIIIAKGNCGTPKLGADGIQYDGTPDLMAEYARMVRDAGARIVGGCCGTTAAHLAAIGRALHSTPQGERPTLEEIGQVFGGT